MPNDDPLKLKNIRGERAKTVKRREIALEILNGPVTPLQIMWDMARGRRKFNAEILEACKACAPYVHPKLAMVHLTGMQGSIGITHEAALEALDADPLAALSDPEQYRGELDAADEVFPQLAAGVLEEEEDESAA